ncbi:MULTISPECIES: gamma-glutamyltransferase family protein [Cobetia]|uniref:gamma-glutamyltransferase family protein n=1 Tax=Cobetia TaxID=204286 RepID=UPI001581E703|nr:MULTISPECIES: gamma-glutamyltransferase family protein [Cobetia]MDI4661238.1 gamma-glutamyltransferase family protein [Cobetia sp. BMC6]NUJ55442.1 gamma-glutamyltransferase family protein [Cobetia marina]
MIHTRRGFGGACAAPHHLAAQAGRDILRDGGNAIEAMVAMAATIAVVYPHMNGIGGDGFWLIKRPGLAPLAIDACGPAAGLASREFYAAQGYGVADDEAAAPLMNGDSIPSRGPLSALTVAGTIGGWQEALAFSAETSADGRSPVALATLLGHAIRHANDGVAVSASQKALSEKHLAVLSQQPGFAERYLGQSESGEPIALEEGARLRQPALAATLSRLADAGLDDFYRGELATRMAQELEAGGSPLRLADLNGYRAQRVTPLKVRLRDSEVYNLPAPTQGLATLMILGLYDELSARHGISEADGNTPRHLHALIEATKRSFLVRDSLITSPECLEGGLAGSVATQQRHLAAEALAEQAARVDMQVALGWPYEPAEGDTIWMGATDSDGTTVSFIQSVYWEFGSGMVLPSSGVMWQNRGLAFDLEPDRLRSLAPGRKPFHTLNPSLACFDDGRVMAFGTMGGEGQPQTQAAVFTRIARHGMSLQDAISAPRWLLGRTWGDVSTSLKLESRLAGEMAQTLAAMGHEVEVLDEAFSDTLGHAGAVMRHPDGQVEAAHDPRSDGGAALT